MRCTGTLATIFFLACFISSTVSQDLQRPAGWTEESHGNRVAANYERVLPDDRINEIFITFTPESWQAEEADMVSIYGERGTDAGRQADAGGARGRARGALPGGRPTGPGGNGGQNGGGQLDQRNPMWVPVSIQFGDQTWWEVGFRYKGQSTLSTGWRSGTVALPFKLDFDEFEDDFPELQNQRFYGFRQMTFTRSLNFDPSLQREKVVADIFRLAGVPAPETAWYAVYVDRGFGDGYEYWGVYTAIELPEDTLIETQFESDDGNMYKPEGRGAGFVAGSFDEATFDKETNQDSGYEDVLALFDALHSDLRLEDPALWRLQLETVFDVDGFLLWLATNTLVQNWNTYGSGQGNYYLYNNPTTDQLVWIPWDNNTALQSTGGRRTPPGLSLSGVNPQQWPLIGYLLQEEDYAGRYRESVARVGRDILAPERMVPFLEQNFQMLAAYMNEREGSAAVESLRHATDELVEHVGERAAAAEAFLSDSAGY